MDVLKSMVYTALRVPGNHGGGTTSDSKGDGGEDDENDEDGMETKRRRNRTQSKKTQLVERGDFGHYLLEFYDVLLPAPTTNNVYLL